MAPAAAGSAKGPLPRLPTRRSHRQNPQAVLTGQHSPAESPAWCRASLLNAPSSSNASSMSAVLFSS
jgi:hypothetical protein